MSGVQQLVPCGSERAEGPPRSGKGGPRRGSRGRAHVDAGRTLSVTKLTDPRIACLVPQVHGRTPRETLGQMLVRWGTPRRPRKLLQRWRRTGTVPRLNPRRRPSGLPLTEEGERQIEEEHTRSPRGTTRLWKDLAARRIHLPHQKGYLYAKRWGWAVPNPRKRPPRGRCRSASGNTRGRSCTPTFTGPP